MKIMHIVGARPNFVKIAPIYREVAQRGDAYEQVLVHTGQHYDHEMSAIFFEEFGLPDPDFNLDVGSGSHAQQTASVMQELEPLLDDHRPDWLVVVGDVNSTLAATLTASKLGIRTAHVEAGLRSRDRTMPEEINRVLTDQIADLLLTPSRDGDENLIREGVEPSRIAFVGNVMIDTLTRLLPRAEARWSSLRDRLGIGDEFVLVTLHRPSNVDDADTLSELVNGLEQLAGRIPVVFPIHPRTRKRMEDFSLRPVAPRLQLLDPLGYIDFMALTANASLVLTDSGGIQEETTYLGVPCLTARPNTERPITITEGTNQLVQSSADSIVAAARKELDRDTAKPAGIPELWDGQAAARIVNELIER